jgi:hypothetical protein
MKDGGATDESPPGGRNRAGRATPAAGRVLGVIALLTGALFALAGAALRLSHDPVLTEFGLVAMGWGAGVGVAGLSMLLRPPRPPRSSIRRVPSGGC